MTVEKVIKALDFSIKAYQKLIDEKILDGEVVGSGVIGKWSANTPINEVYQEIIDAFKATIEIIYNFQKIEQSKSALLYKIYMAGVNMTGEYQGCWVRFKDIENIINKHFENKSKEAAGGNEENES